MSDTSLTTEKQPNRLRRGVAFIKANKKRFFWYWIGYQCVKGALTTSLIWIPLLYVWLTGTHS